MRVAIDIGGTFTDLVAARRPGAAAAPRRRSPRRRPRRRRARLPRQGRRCDLAAVDRFVHGSTVAINTVVERKGARTAPLITTEGCRDVYEIARGNRPDAYNLHFAAPAAAGAARPPPGGAGAHERPRRGPVPLEELAGRARAALEAADVQAVAVCLLHAYANPAHEQQIGAYLQARHPSGSSALPRDPPRGARVRADVDDRAERLHRPGVSRYLAELEELLERSRFRGQTFIMQSNGGTMSRGHRAQPTRGDDGVGPGRRGHRGRGRRAGARLPERDLLRHGRDDREDQPGPRRRAGGHAAPTTSGATPPATR